MARPLRSGFTTGACAAAAAKGAALLLRDREAVPRVVIDLPAGFAAPFALHGQQLLDGEACCFVVKDAGDDPDVTHGVEVHAEVRLLPAAAGEDGVVLRGGPGIGRVTKPGLAVAVGEWAINPVPRQMILAAVRSVFPPPQGVEVTLTIPDGVERARRTLNARLGILGGLSILGTSGVVRPISHQAWTDTLDVALDVARAAGCESVVLSTGRSSEAAAQALLQDHDGFPEEAFVMMGDHVGFALQACHRKGVPGVILAVQFAKLLKIACGHPQTHVSASRLDLAQLARWARQSGLDDAVAAGLECANTAREIYLGLGRDHPLIATVATHALEQLRRWGAGVTVGVLLADYAGGRPRSFGQLPIAVTEEKRP
ncbi:cobalt-precorrin-5B C1-methyltransferase [Desulfuromonas sp. DDH964]|uniref:cobalt-precorrin-5B (C(1))-methyltransferase CbiD n=1 Tax=Desulfuromonas sp. DDH964 TaxID=1823759 RepID=UPI00078DA898|nr:cobalt-precorrin-5B (C(1))-methyltransferase CbiD [Desulfuromonas sp. DDH964]AMV73402.1 cobalt-precorrin-5B C1-methyltransferase [Desulfuromonas sp. DDH964]